MHNEGLDYVFSNLEEEFIGITTTTLSYNEKADLLQSTSVARFSSAYVGDAIENPKPGGLFGVDWSKVRWGILTVTVVTDFAVGISTSGWGFAAGIGSSSVMYGLLDKAFYNTPQN